MVSEEIEPAEQVISNRTLLMVLAVCSISAETVHAHGTGFQLLPDRAVFCSAVFL